MRQRFLWAAAAWLQKAMEHESHERKLQADCALSMACCCEAQAMCYATETK